MQHPHSPRRLVLAHRTRITTGSVFVSISSVLSFEALVAIVVELAARFGAGGEGGGGWLAVGRGWGPEKVNDLIKYILYDLRL